MKKRKFTGFYVPPPDDPTVKESGSSIGRRRKVVSKGEIVNGETFGRLMSHLDETGLWAKLSFKAKAVYGTLVMNADNKTGRVFLTAPHISEKSGVGKTQVREALNELESEGLIRTWLHTRDKDGNPTTQRHIEVLHIAYVLYSPPGYKPREKPNTYRRDSEAEGISQGKNLNLDSEKPNSELGKTLGHLDSDVLDSFLDRSDQSDLSSHQDRETPKTPIVEILDKEYISYHRRLSRTIGWRINWVRKTKKQANKIMESFYERWPSTPESLAKFVLISYRQNYPKLYDKDYINDVNYKQPHGGNYFNWLKDETFEELFQEHVEKLLEQSKNREEQAKLQEEWKAKQLQEEAKKAKECPINSPALRWKYEPAGSTCTLCENNYPERFQKCYEKAVKKSNK